MNKKTTNVNMYVMHAIMCVNSNQTLHF